MPGLLGLERNRFFPRHSSYASPMLPEPITYGAGGVGQLVENLRVREARPEAPLNCGGEPVEIPAIFVRPFPMWRYSVFARHAFVYSDKIGAKLPKRIFRRSPPTASGGAQMPDLGVGFVRQRPQFCT